ncbi:MAG: alpha-hydroxy acid oxidase, partial [Woeseiaceae bacterium]|nr:alpha-hydroxy acid oxidase [Woeseiaceae bacterium]
MRVSTSHNIADLRRLAKRRLPAPVFHYIDGGADDELTLRRNTEAFNDYELLPSQLSDVSSIDTRTTLFGEPVEWPVMISPTGGSKLFHGDGEAAVAAVAAQFGMIYSLSTLATTTIEDAAGASDGPKLYQLYIFRDRALTEEHIDRCRDAGYRALCLTADTPVAGNRERDFVHGFSASPRSRLRQVLSFARYPGWLYRALVRKELEMVNITSARAAQAIEGSIRDFIDAQLERSLTWKDVEWLASKWNGPLVVKGIQTVDDCRKAADAGATAVMLSNHGGRQLESAPAP